MKARQLVEEYLESLIDVAAQGNANSAEFHAEDIERIFSRSEPKPKQTLYMVHEETRNGTDTYELNSIEGVEIEEHHFFFDQMNGDLQVEEIEYDIERLEALQKKVASPTLVDMVKERKEWLVETKAYAERDAKENAKAAERALEAARKVLREAGELPEVPDGSNTTHDQA